MRFTGILALLLLTLAVLWGLPNVRAKFFGPASASIFRDEYGYAFRGIVLGKPTLLPKDVAEILRLARKEMWQGVTWRSCLPDFSRTSFRTVPANLRRMATRRIVGITVKADDYVEVWIWHKDPCASCGKWEDWPEYGVRLKKGQNGWQVLGLAWGAFHCEG